MERDAVYVEGTSTSSLPSSHRMPTVSIAQALDDLKSSPLRCISTGLALLDSAIQNREPILAGKETFYGGVSRGKVTEIYGPPGVGKTALGMNLAASALHNGESVIWADASHPIPSPRLSQILGSFRSMIPESTDTVKTSSTLEALDNLVHFKAPTLSHLVAFLSQQNQGKRSDNTSLIVIDSFSTLIGNAFPRSAELTKLPKRSNSQNLSNRKFSLLQYVMNSFQKIAATRNIAIVILSQCVTKVRPGASAVLVPAINTTGWEQGLGCRIALFRGWGWDDEYTTTVNDVRLALVLKAESINVSERRLKYVGFSVSETGLYALDLPFLPTLEPLRHDMVSANFKVLGTVLPQKRKLATIDLEIPDSDGEDDEDYGWAEDDEEDIPPPPPQWQGSEDVLAPAEGELEADGEAFAEPDLADQEVELLGAEHSDGLDRNGQVEVDDSEDELAL